MTAGPLQDRRGVSGVRWQLSSCCGPGQSPIWMKFPFLFAALPLSQSAQQFHQFRLLAAAGFGEDFFEVGFGRIKADARDIGDGGEVAVTDKGKRHLNFSRRQAELFPQSDFKRMCGGGGGGEFILIIKVLWRCVRQSRHAELIHARHKHFLRVVQPGQVARDVLPRPRFQFVAEKLCAV